MMRRKADKDTPFICGFEPSSIHRKEKEIGDGSWVLIKTRIPVEERIRPITYGIYWAIPAPDEYGRQKVKVYTPEEVCLLNYEYTPITEERLQEYRDIGYYLCETAATRQTTKLEMKILEEGRSLCEEEREVIWALQLDGLSETQACEEYFLTHHTDDTNIGVCFLPTEEMITEIVSVFGENGIPG